MLRSSRITAAAVVVLCAIAACGGRSNNQIPSAIDKASLEKISDRATPDTTGAEASKPTYSARAEPGTMRGFLRSVMNDVARYWRQVFAKGGTGYRSPSYVVLDTGDSPKRSNCRGRYAYANSGPFYCLAGGEVGAPRLIHTPVIYFGAPWLYTTMRNVNPSNFDFAVASVVAHEFGHHVQELLLQAGNISPKPSRANSRN